VKGLAWPLCAILACCTLLVLSMDAQIQPNLEQGLKPYGSYQGGNIDSVSLTNGNLNLHVPLVSYPQRGGKLSLSFSLRYNNKGWTSVCADYGFGIFCRWDWGGAGVEIVRDQTLGIQDNSAWFPLTRDPSVEHYVSIVYAVTSDGGMHLFGDAGESLDASGIQSWGVPGTGWGVTDRAGVRHTLALVGSQGAPVSSEDPNGNKISVSSSGWTDTLGRVIPGSAPTANEAFSHVYYESILPGVPWSDLSPCPGAAFARIWNLPGPNGGAAPIVLCYADFALSTNFQIKDYAEATPFWNRMLSAVVLPDGTNWSFNYNSYGDLSSITLPTGGIISYTWASSSNWGTWKGVGPPASRVVATRSADPNDGSAPKTWTYQYPVTMASGNVTYNTFVTDPAGNSNVHTIKSPLPPNSASLYVTRSQYYQGSYTNGTLLKTVNTEYSADNNPYSHYTGVDTLINVVPIKVTTIWPNGKVSQIQRVYDAGQTTSIYWNVTDNYLTYTFKYGNVLQESEFDYGQNTPGVVDPASVSPGPLLRKTITAYRGLDDVNYKNFNLLNLASSVTVQNGSGTQVARTTYDYDQPSTLFSSGITTQHNLSPANGTYRGNATLISRWLGGTTTATSTCPVSVNNGYVATNLTYFDTGTLKTSSDPCGHTTTFSYSSTFFGAYVTQTQLPDTNAPNLAHHVTSGNYDFNSGLLNSSIDENGLTTTFAYDNMFRLIQMNSPDGGQTSFAYAVTAPFKVTATRKVSATQNLVRTAVLDGLARVKQTQLNSDPQGAVYMDATYDGLGRKATVSNPYRSTADLTYGITSLTYDALGRTAKVIPPDGTVPSNNLTTVYSDNCTTVADQAGKKRKSCVDGLGRLIAVWEPDAAGSLVYETDYQYDTLDNLTRVDQKGNTADSTQWRTRTFTYNSLSQLLTATNPESGTISYTYDADGNLLTKADARSITSTFGYDPLHRLTGKTYSNADPAISYFYDQASYNGLTIANRIGRRTGMSDAAGAEAWSYDAMGRVLTGRRTTNGLSKNTSYTYNLDGSVGTVTYPSGRVIAYSYNAAARPLSAVDSANAINYALSASYAPQGALSSLLLGQSGTFGGINLNQSFNSRLQPLNIRAWSTSGTVLDLSYGFNLGTANNGNVASVANNRNHNRDQSYTYDQLNRVATAQTAATSGSDCWGLSFGYDVWANLLSETVTKCSAPMLSLGVNTQNRITNTGFSYDVAGNMVSDGSLSYAWDAESRMKAGAGVNYTYDGDGKRVQKSTGKLYWYGLSSDPLAESNATGNITDEYVFFGGKRIARSNSTSGVTYYFSDHLGSSRVVTSATGAILDDSDFYPFGGERPVVSSSGNNYKFNGKERDSESGLDYFGARYYSSAAARFSSADEAPPNLFNPQSLNRYAYALDNPLAFVDPDGNFAFHIHVELTTTVLAKEGYSGDVARAVAKSNAQVDVCCNDRGHAFMHSQTGPGETVEQAKAQQAGFVEASLDLGAAAVLSGDVKSAEISLGQALHAVQDEKHDFIEFDKHTGNPGNDRKTPEGRFQEKTDFNPTQQQLARAAQRTIETVQRFEDKIRNLGRKQGLSKDEVEGRIAELKAGKRKRRNPDAHPPGGVYLQDLPLLVPY